MLQADSDILKQLKSDDQNALKQLFDEHFQGLYQYACRITNDQGAAEEIVQDVFVNLWTGKDNLKIKASLLAYLKTSVKNRCINHLKKKYVVLETSDEDQIAAVMHSHSSHESYQADELSQLISNALKSLPEKTQLIFSMSRNMDLSHKEIAEQLDISQKGVEYHMANALRHLRQFLTHHGYCIVLIQSLNNFFSKIF